MSVPTADEIRTHRLHNYKHLKEQFVSNLSGGLISDINEVTLAAPAAILLWTALQSRFGFFVLPTPLSSAVEFLLICIVPLIATTIYASNPLLLDLALLVPSSLLLFPQKPDRPGLESTGKARPRPDGQRFAEGKPDALAGDHELFPPKAFLTHYRGAMIVITCVAILAVDFRLFPRRFAKVETWGTSLMDLGVGSFVFSAGLVSAKPLCRDVQRGETHGIASRTWSACRHSIPLLVLGFVRLYSVKGLDYAEHVSEYGVHWNFFFTLAFIAPFVAFAQSVYSLVPSFALLALALSSFYEILLQTTSLTAYILTAPRLDLLSENREGIFSLLGYTSIFMMGQQAGLIVLPRENSLVSGASRKVSMKGKKESRNRSWAGIPAQYRLLGMAGLNAILFLFVTNHTYGLSLQVSRRLANLAYVLWTSAYNLAQISLFWGIDQHCFGNSSESNSRTSFRNRTSTILRAFNRNGLAVFLLANLGTGLVNLTVDTLQTGAAVSLAILSAYIGALAAISVVLQHFNVSLKF